MSLRLPYKGREGIPLAVLERARERFGVGMRGLFYPRLKSEACSILIMKYGIHQVLNSPGRLFYQFSAGRVGEVKRNPPY